MKHHAIHFPIIVYKFHYLTPFQHSPSAATFLTKTPETSLHINFKSFCTGVASHWSPYLSHSIKTKFPITTHHETCPLFKQPYKVTASLVYNDKIFFNQKPYIPSRNSDSQFAVFQTALLDQWHFLCNPAVFQLHSFAHKPNPTKLSWHHAYSRHLKCYSRNLHPP